MGLLMSAFASHTFRLLAVIAALFLFTSQGQAASAQARLQQVADEAALAAVQVLGANNAQTEAVEAARQIISPISGVTAEVAISATDLVATVKLSAADATTLVTSTARYVPPEQPATWSWASRQRFAFKPPAVIFGSNCIGDCGVNPLR
jgi:Flp pilus assembly protein TadG